MSGLGKLFRVFTSPISTVLSGTVVDDILQLFGGIIDRVVDGEQDAEKIKDRINKLAEQNRLKEIDLMANIILAEVNSSNTVQRLWRPLIMLGIGAILINTFLVAPYIYALFGVDVSSPLPESLYDLLGLGIGGYVIGRSIEKSVNLLNKNRQ